MEFNTDLCSFAEDSIEPCRTCGIYFTIGLDMNQKLVRPLFDTDDAASAPTAMVEILEQMSAWKLKVARDDGRPQYMCISCIAEFQKLLKFKQSCLETQEQFGELELQREHNGMVIKREIIAEPDEKFCGYVYLDVSDEEEEISDEDGSKRVSAAFDIPHVPIKQEHMARVPIQTKATFLPPEPKELEPPIESSLELIKTEKLTNMFTPSADPAESEEDEEEQEEEGIIKFTYDDDSNSAATLPQPIVDSVATVTCKLCSFDSPSEEAHLEHMQRTHLLKNWECHICAKKFIGAPESRLKFHMKWHKLQRHIKCPMCGFFCSSKDTLNEHTKAVHTRTKCSFCGKNIRSNLFQRHINQHLEERKAELADQLNLLEQSQFDVAPLVVASVTPLPPVIPTITVTNAYQEGIPSPGADSPALVASTTPENVPVKIKEDTSSWQDGVPAQHDPTMEEPPATVDSFEPADICIIQCAFCSDTFDNAEQLGAHVLATHRKRRHSPDKTPSPVQSAKVSRLEKMSDSSISETSLCGSPETSSSDNMQKNSKTYSPCPLCNKSFDLKFKLNRHLLQHKAPF